MGADYRLYAGIEVGGYECSYLNWITPEENETLKEYAIRLTQDLGEGPFVLVGSSFGGVVSLELSTILNVKHVVLIGAPFDPKGFTPWVRIALRLGNAMGKSTAWLPTNGITRILQVSRDHRPLFREMLNTVPRAFIPFAIRSLESWDPQYTVSVTQLVGERDRLVRRLKNSNGFIIKQGGHCLTLDKPQEVSNILADILQHFG